MRNSYTTTFIFLLSWSVYAQENILPVGGNVKNTTGSVSYSIGQVFYVQHQQSTGSIAEGVQHPLEILNGSVSAESIDWRDLISVYPNPFTESVHVNFSHWHGDVSLKLFDGLGREVAHLDMQYNTATTFDLSHLSAGAYNLIVSSVSKVYATFTIVKSR